MCDLKNYFILHFSILCLESEWKSVLFYRLRVQEETPWRTHEELGRTNARHRIPAFVQSWKCEERFSPLFPHGYTKNFTSLMNVNFDSADSQRRGRSQVASTFLTYLYVGLLMRWFSRVRFIAIFSTSKHVWVWLSTGDTNNSIKYFIFLFRLFGRIWHIISFFPLILMLIFWRRCLRGSTSFSQARAGERVGPALSGRPNVAQPWPKLYLLLKRGIP